MNIDINDQARDQVWIQVLDRVYSQVWSQVLDQLEVDNER